MGKQEHRFQDRQIYFWELSTQEKKQDGLILTRLAVEGKGDMVKQSDHQSTERDS
jgi:hypothetical protein